MSIRDAALARHSDLYRYMMRHYSRLEREIGTVRRPSWRGLARYFAEQNVLVIENEKRAAELARQTWWKVRRDRAGKAKPKPKPTGHTVLPTPQIHVAKPETAPAVAQDDADDRQFRPVRSRE